MDQSRRAELRRLCEGATPGPWRVGPVNYADIYEPEGDLIVLVTKPRERAVSDAQFIVHARSAVPELLDALDAAEGEVIHWTERVDATTRENLRLTADLKAAEAERDRLIQTALSEGVRADAAFDRAGQLQDAVTRLAGCPELCKACVAFVATIPFRTSPGERP